MVSGPAPKYSIHFDFLLVYSLRKWSRYLKQKQEQTRQTTRTGTEP